MAAQTTTPNQPNDTQIQTGAAAAQTNDAHASAAAGAQAKFHAEATGAPVGAHVGDAAANPHTVEGTDNAAETIKGKFDAATNLGDVPKVGVNSRARELMDNSSPVSPVHTDTIKGPDGKDVTGQTHVENGKTYLTSGEGKFQVDKSPEGNRSLTAVDKNNKPLERGDGKPEATTSAGKDNKPANVGSDVASHAAHLEANAKKESEVGNKEAQPKPEPSKGLEGSATKAPGSDKTSEGHDTPPSAAAPSGRSGDGPTPPAAAAKPVPAHESTTTTQAQGRPTAPPSGSDRVEPSKAAQGPRDTHQAGANAALHNDSHPGATTAKPAGDHVGATHETAVKPEASHAHDASTQSGPRNGRNPDAPGESTRSQSGGDKPKKADDKPSEVAPTAQAKPNATAPAAAAAAKGDSPSGHHTEVNHVEQPRVSARTSDGGGTHPGDIAKQPGAKQPGANSDHPADSTQGQRRQQTDASHGDAGHNDGNRPDGAHGHVQDHGSQQQQQQQQPRDGAKNNQQGTTGGDTGRGQGETHHAKGADGATPPGHHEQPGSKADTGHGGTDRGGTDSKTQDKKPTADAAANQANRQQQQSRTSQSSSTTSQDGDARPNSGRHNNQSDASSTATGRHPNDDRSHNGQDNDGHRQGDHHNRSQQDGKPDGDGHRQGDRHERSQQDGKPDSDGHRQGDRHDRSQQDGKRDGKPDGKIDDAGQKGKTSPGSQSDTPGAAPGRRNGEDRFRAGQDGDSHHQGDHHDRGQRQNNNDSQDSGNPRRRGSKQDDTNSSAETDKHGQTKVGPTSSTTGAQPAPPPGKGNKADVGPGGTTAEREHPGKLGSELGKIGRAVEGFHRDHGDHDRGDHDRGDHDRGEHDRNDRGGPRNKDNNNDQIGQPKGRPQPPADQSQQPGPPKSHQPVVGPDGHVTDPGKGQLLRGGIHNDDQDHHNRGGDKLGAQPGGPFNNLRNDIKDARAIAKLFDGGNDDHNRGNRGDRGDMGRQGLNSNNDGAAKGMRGDRGLNPANPHDAPGAMGGHDGNDRAAKIADLAARIALDGIGRNLGRNAAGADGGKFRPIEKDAAALIGMLARDAFGNNRGQNNQNPGQQFGGSRNNAFGPGGALGTALRDFGMLAHALEGQSHARDAMAANAGGLSGDGHSNIDGRSVGAYPGAVAYGDGHGGAIGAGSDSDSHGAGSGASSDGHGDGSSTGDGHGASGDGHGDAAAHAAHAAHRAGELTALELGQALMAIANASKHRGGNGISVNPGSTTAIGALGAHGETEHHGKHDDKEDDHLPGSHLTHVESSAMLAPGLIKYGNLPRPDQVGKPDAVSKGDAEGIGGAGRRGLPEGSKDSTDHNHGIKDGFHPGERGVRGLGHDIGGMMSGQTAGNRLDLSEGKEHGHRKDDDEDDKEGFGVHGHKLDPKHVHDERIRKQAEKDAADQIAANARSVMIAAMLNSKNKQNAANKDEKLGLKDSKKKGEDKRSKYVVKEKETLESIAKKQLRDIRLAALIYEINKHMLPLRMERGKQVADPRPGTPIWLPSDSDIRDFRARIYSGETANSSHAKGASGAKSAEDELSEKFGANWDGSSSPGASAIQANLMGAAVAKSQVRQSNIERVLGPIATTKAPEAGRIRYIVRLSDTIDGVAVKHPALKDSDLWPLLANLNNLPTDVDGLGKPIAQLRRGMVLDVPSPAEIDEFRQGVSAVSESETTADMGNATGEMDPILRDMGVSQKPVDVALAPLPESKAVSAPAPFKPIIKPAASVTAYLPALQSGAVGQGIANTSQPISKLPEITDNGLPASIFQPYQPDQETRPLPPVMPAHQDYTQVMPVSTSTDVPPQTVPVQYFSQAAVPPDLVSGGVASQTLSQLSLQNVTAPMPAPQAPVPQQQLSQPPVPTTVDSPLMPQPAIKPVNKPTAAEVMMREPIVAGDRYMWELERGVRLVKSALRWDPNVGVYRAQLEVLYGGTWYPVIFYEVFPQGAVRHEYMAGGKRKSVNMDLPPIAVQELADNDVVNNWSDYCKRFINHLLGRS